MAYKRSLTYAARMEIDRYVAKQTARANAQLDSQQTAEELLRFLQDRTKLATPGFVLRRHIQAQGGLVPPETCADLSKSGNVPWPEEVVDRIAEQLSIISYHDHGLEIKPEQWKDYLAVDMPQGPHRKRVFQIAVITGMGRQTTVDLLMAWGQPAYNMRSPLELICWFCQYVPGTYTWRDIRDLLKKYERFSAEAKKDAAGEPEREAPAEGTTRLLRWSVEEILGSSDPAPEAERQLMELMAENCGELKGFSRTARNNYLRLLDYLYALFPEGADSLRMLSHAMLERQEWYFEDFLQTSDGPRYVYRGEAEDRTGPRMEEYTLDLERGRIALFCKRFYERASGIRAGALDADRRDVLLLGYFLITGYMEAEPETRDAFWAVAGEEKPAGRPAKKDMSVDGRMKKLRSDLDALRPKSDMMDKKVLCLRVLNELLAQFGFRAFYVPAAFDRFVLFCLLTDRPAWTGRYLLGEEMEEYDEFED